MSYMQPPSTKQSKINYQILTKISFSKSDSTKEMNLQQFQEQNIKP